MSNRDELERQVAEAMQKVFPNPEQDQDEITAYSELAAAVLDALGLTEETVWTDDGDPEVQRNTPDGIWIGPDDVGHTDEAMGDRLRQAGWKLKRRYVTTWEDITDANR